MQQPLSVLAIGRSKDAVAPVVALLEKQRVFSVAAHIVGNGHADPLRDAAHPQPDALVLALDNGWRESLPGLVSGLPSAHPPFFVVSPESDVDLFRAAMRAGARDVFVPPFNPEDFASALARIAEEEHERTGSPSAQVISFMNAKGGSGASFLAANVAVVLATLRTGRAVLMDLDFQFGSAASYLDLPAKTGLIKALELVDTLDASALPAYTQPHSSGLDLLAAAMNDIILPEDVSEQRVTKLLAVLDGIYRTIVVDLPRRIDSLTAAVLLKSDKIVLVTQQTIAHLNETKRLVFLLEDQLGIPIKRLLLLVNRYDKKAEVRLGDFSSVFPALPIEVVPGDYHRVAESINLGIPLSQGAPRSPLGKRLSDLAMTIATAPTEVVPKRGGVLGWLNRSARN